MVHHCCGRPTTREPNGRYHRKRAVTKAIMTVENDNSPELRMELMRLKWRQLKLRATTAGVTKQQMKVAKRQAKEKARKNQKASKNVTSERAIDRIVK